MENKIKYLFDVKYTNTITKTVRIYENLKLSELHDLLQGLSDAENIIIKTKKHYLNINN